MTEIEARTVDVFDPYDWLPHEVRERQDKENVISLSEAQQKNEELMTTIGGNLQSYIGMKVLNNMPVGTGKTTWTIEGMNLAQRVPKLVALGQHNLANEYCDRLQTDSIIHLFGRTHKVVGCPYKDEAETLCSMGYSVYFKLHYCSSKCEKADNCIHLENSKKAKHAEVLIVMHSHIELMDFLMSDYYGNNLRQLIVIDEAPKLVRDIYFTGQDIIDNLCRFRNLTAKLKGKGLLFVEHASKAEALVRVLEGMDKALNEVVKSWEYNDPKNPDLTREVNLYIQNNSMADMEQLEGRILRGEDTFKLIIRLHNVNIRPYPDEVYKSWQTMLKEEFGYIKPKELKGKAKETYEWLVENARGREFTAQELVDGLGGYKRNYWRTLRQLETMGCVKETKKGQQGRGNTSVWMLTL